MRAKGRASNSLTRGTISRPPEIGNSFGHSGVKPCCISTTSRLVVAKSMQEQKQDTKNTKDAQRTQKYFMVFFVLFVPPLSSLCPFLLPLFLLLLLLLLLRLLLPLLVALRRLDGRLILRRLRFI